MVKARIGIIRRIAAVIAVVFGIALTGFAEAVTNVRGSQRENSKLVDIYYDLNDTDGGTYYVEVEIVGKTSDVNASSFSGDVGEGISPGQNRHIVWDAGADWPGNKGDVKAIVTATIEEKGKHGKVQLWEGGPYWATTNIGANNPWEYGLYFWWGDTTGYLPSGTTFSFRFDYANPAIYTYEKYGEELQSVGWVTNAYALASAHDAAHVQWGGGWRMPTPQELEYLSKWCNWTWTMTNGVNGYVVCGSGIYASNSIFLPCAGIGSGASFINAGFTATYWSSTLQSDRYTAAHCLNIGHRETFYHGTSQSSRFYGHSVRPVQSGNMAEEWTDHSEWFFVGTTDGDAIFPSLGEGATAEDVGSALSVGTDAGLTNITDVAVYEAFRQWVDSVKGVDGLTTAGAQAVKDSTRAWLSFALGADKLIGKDITSNDVHIVSFRAESAGGGLGTSPASFAFEVAIDGVEIGSGSVAEETLKANLKKVLGLEGATTLAAPAGKTVDDLFSSDNIEITFDVPVNGNARFIATPPTDVGGTFFMRVKVK